MDDSIGIDLGETLIRIISLKRKGKFFEILNMGSLIMDPAFFRSDSTKLLEKTASDLSNTIKQLKIKKKNAKIVVPDSVSYNHIIEMPKLNEKELLSAIKYQADQFIPMPLDDVNMDIEILYEDQKNKKMLTLISAAPKSLLLKVESLMEYAGLFPETVETEITSTGRLINEIFKKDVKQAGEKHDAILLINLGYNSSSLYLFDQDLGTIILSHNFLLGYSLFLKEIQVNLNVDQNKAVELLKTFGLTQNTSYHLDTILAPAIKNLTSELEKFTNEVVSKYKIQIKNIFLFNYALHFNSFDQLIGRYFGIPSSPLNLYPFFVRNNILESYKNEFGFFVSAVGALLR